MRIPSHVLVPSYAVFGPPLGALAFWVMTLLPYALLATVDRGVDARAWAALFKLLGTYAVFSYLLGVFPALGAGIVHAVIRRRSWPSTVLVGAVGLTGAALTAALILVGANARAQDSLTLFMVAAGGISALLIAMLFQGLVSLGSRGDAVPSRAG